MGKQQLIFNIYFTDVRKMEFTSQFFSTTTQRQFFFELLLHEIRLLRVWGTLASNIKTYSIQPQKCAELQ